MCAFGVLVKQWGILKMAIQSNVSIKNKISLVIALEKVHNFYIDDSLDLDESTSLVDIEEVCIQDTEYIQIDDGGFVPLVCHKQLEHTIPDDLLDGGSLDNNRSTRSQIDDDTCLPRSKSCKHVVKTLKIYPWHNKQPWKIDKFK